MNVRKAHPECVVGELNKMQLKVAFSQEKLDSEERKSSDVSDGNLYA